MRSEGPSPLPALIDAPRRGVEAEKASSTQTAQVTVIPAKEEKEAHSTR